MQHARNALCLCLATVAIAGCATDSESTDEGVQIEQVDRGVEGWFSFDGTELTFSSIEVDADQLEVVIELNGLTLMAIVDVAEGVSELDGFATDTGANTQILQADRIVLTQLMHELDALGGDLDRPTTYLRRVVGLFSEHPDSMDLNRQVIADPGRSYSSICWALNSFQPVTHDDWDYDRWDDASTLDAAYISMHGSCGAADGTYFWKNGSWQCYEPDHDASVEYAYGNCFGRCGSGCGGDTQFTWDCADHDSCVRTGHSTASFWCDDEFASASDDFLSAPNCY